MVMLVALAIHADDSIRGRSANPHGKITIACESCHATTSWKPIREKPEFNHNTQTHFALFGMHQSVACRNCHVSLEFAKAPTQCAQCHADLHRGQFGSDCQKCHTVQGWKVAVSAIQQHNNRFPLLGAHSAATCEDCHRGAASGVFTGLSTACVSCHLKDYQSGRPLDHVAAHLPNTCDTCHSMDTWQGARFDHALFANFPLLGAHASLACTSCHVGGRFAGTPSDCFSCHVTDFTNVQNPNHVAANFSHDCAQCHTTATWANATFDHSKMTSFPLTGAHASVTCAQCHVGGRFAGTPTACVGCHLTDFNNTTNPNHVQGGFPTTCDTCHSTTNWQGAKFDHSTTRFPLNGAHTTVACEQCHINGNFVSTPLDCVGCHLTDFQKTTNPNHVTSGFPQDCKLCHTTAQWQGATFDHNTATKFALTGVHATVQCAQCHANGVFAGTPMQCAGCHLSDYQKTTNPNHVTEKFSQDCATCHTTAGWTGATFNHNQTAFPLTGAHTTVSCDQCHVNGRFAGTPTDCSGCHLADFQKTTNPNHVSGGFPNNCTMCHTTTQWQGASFDHSTATKFPLSGAHTSVPCSQCHVNGVFAGTSMQCVGCHLTDFQKTTNPNHVAGGFSQDCIICHTTATWAGAQFDHSKTAFPLTGAHATVQCAQCHVNGQFAGTTTQCVGCHLNDYNTAANPNHKAAGFPQDCTVCHTTAQWTGAKFDHSTTGFSLTGAHTSVQCIQCHANNNFSLNNAACITCHLTDFNATDNPNHQAAGFPRDCTVCHNTTAWTGAKFDHSTTGFTLTGAHTSLQCAQCHTNNNYSLTSGACITCHLTDFNNTTAPPHKSSAFPQDCTGCHNTTTWSGASFNHATTGFALTGAHTALQCAQCHVSGNFSLTNAACINCHLTDYNNTTNPSHKAAGFPQDCTLCHNTAQWTGAKFDHATTGFALTGAHTTVQCAQCHVNGNYSLTSTACVDCHLADYNGTNNPPHKSSGFPTDCSGCHTTATWSGATFNHATTGFALTGAHNSLQCTQCHVNNNFSLTSAACINCHLTDYNGTTDPNHKAAGFPQDCTVCHNTTAWTGAKFDHSTTGFTLTGAHTSLQCAQCHVNGNYSLTSAACVNCHLTDYNNTTNPPHKSAAFPQDCTGCHNTTTWTGATFNHSTTGFALTGAHTSLQCAQCHVNGNFSLTSAACINCHLTDYNGATSPNHKAAGFPQDCTLCHTTAQWTGAKFDHSTTGFTLTGAHTSLQCAQCHVNNNYSLTSAACIACHLTDYNNTTNPAHKAAGFPQDCTGCHNTTTWTGATFNHTTTGFALTGAHTSLQCAQCHVNGNFSLSSGACINCHLTDYNNTTDPPHKSSGFPQDCTGCHTTTTWSGATFNHATTGFALTGAHTSVQCTQCHVNNNYSLTSAACINCHLNDYNGATNPNHKSAGFPQDCTLCHTTTQWTGATFNHTTTGFALTGAHTTLQCAQCHVNNNYSLTSAACVNCHLTDYNGTTNPAHKSAGFPTDCAGCHTTTAWTGATFNHATTGFALTGAHTSVQCAQCHVNNNYSLTSAACVNCHLTDYNGATSPPHKSAGFPTDCTLCHNTNQWTGATFNHTTTGFALTGAHTSLQCAQCHVNNNYSLTSAACINCHLTDYNGTTDPPHKSAGFPQDCSVCHNTTAWTGATFNHTTTGFTLTGAHTSLQCAQCHVNGNYSLTSGACWNCHQTDYNGTTNPAHKAAGFPQDCSGCHTTTNWDGATFNHATTGFALTGAHTSVQCAQCHVNGNFSLTSAACVNCHLTDYNGATNPPHQSSGFPQDCTLCHDSIKWTDATFNHTTTGFALTGAHTSLQCAQCHVNSNYSLTSGACWNCHQTDYNGTTNPPHKAAGFAQDCSTCHTTTNWNGATFNHTTTGFALTGAHTSLQCAQCHVNSNFSLNSSNTACYSCHTTDYNNTTDPPHKTSGFPTDCTLCHNTTQWTGATFDHSTTGFALTGAHTSLQCAQCHTNGNYSLTSASAACYNCHVNDYNGTTNPPHKSSGFPTDCSGCHTTTNWDGATFNHTTTGFALTGAHTSLQCTQCHVNNNFSLNSSNTACYGCHATDYNGTTNPAHQAAGFPQDCSVCHSTTNWSGATFTHPQTPFALTGAHATLLTNNQCLLCHVNNVFTGTPTDCYSCHKTDYTGTTNPNHAAAAFSTTCSTCHTTTDWTGAKYTAHDSSYFPIYSGNHNGKWTTCADCHTNAADYSVFSCIICHQHSNQTSVTNEHNGVKNFVYNGTSCYSCHPRGSGG
jgi:hypothetical protein